ncbi:MAG TPA: hypothetical protein VF815_26855, partial [Myxococcaceae bacterium]
MVLSPNVIKGSVRFANVNPEVLSILQAEGMDTIVVSAESTAGYAASTNFLVPTNYLGGPYQLSAEASGGTGSVSYSVGAMAWVNNGARSGAAGSGNGLYIFTAQPITLRPVEVQPDGVTLNFTETVGVVRIRFGTDASCSTPVPILQALVSTSRGYNYLNDSPPVANYSMGYYLMPGGTTLTATIDITTGTSEDWDTIKFRHIVEFPAGPDEIQDVCIPIPSGEGDGSLGAIATPFQVVGHTVIPQASYIWASDGPQGNRRITFLGGSTPPEQPSSTWPRLPNLMPGQYSLWSEGLLDLGDRQVAFKTNPGAPPRSSRTTVIAGQTVDPKQTFTDGEHHPFVIHPPYFNGSIRLYDPYVERNPNAQSSLAKLSFHTQWPSDSLGGTTRGPRGGTTLSASGGEATAYTSFPARFQAAQGQLADTYSLPLVTLFDQPEAWQTPSLSLKYASEPQTIIEDAVSPTHYDYEYHYYYMHPSMAPQETYRLGTMTLSQYAPAVTVQPGQVYSQTHHYCFNEVRFSYLSNLGSFVNPVAYVVGGFEGLDFEGNTVKYTADATFYGTPAVGVYQPEDVYLAGRSTEGVVAFALPQGSWKISAGATFVYEDGTSSSGNFPGVELTVGCGQRVEPLPDLAVSINLEGSCQEGHAASVTGTVNTENAPVDHIWYRLDDQLFELCTSNCAKNFS